MGLSPKAIRFLFGSGKLGKTSKYGRAVGLNKLSAWQNMQRAVRAAKNPRLERRAVNELVRNPANLLPDPPSRTLRVLERVRRVRENRNTALLGAGAAVVGGGLGVARVRHNRRNRRNLYD